MAKNSRPIVRYGVLRGMMARCGDTNEDLAAVIRRSVPYVSRLLNGHRDFTFEDAYRILDHYYEPYEMLHVYFPPKGIAPETEEAPRNSAPRQIKTRRAG